MLGEVEGFSGSSSGWQSNKCSQSARSGGGSDLSSGESKFLRKRNLK
jgi:hypothetical protein